MRLTHAFPALIAFALALPAQAAAPAPAPDVDLTWLAGAWCGDAQGERVEETWLSPLAGELVGLSRTVRDGRPVSYEFMRIAPVDGVPTFFAQPGGKPPTAFPAVDAGEGRIRFANDHHDFPQWIEYRREGNGLRAEIGGPGGEGKELRIEFRYVACPSPAA
jgi:hypothetical protein